MRTPFGKVTDKCVIQDNGRLKYKKTAEPFIMGLWVNSSLPIHRRYFQGHFCEWEVSILIEISLLIKIIL